MDQDKPEKITIWNTQTNQVPIYEPYKSPTPFWDSYTGETNYLNYQGKFLGFQTVETSSSITFCSRCRNTWCSCQKCSKCNKYDCFGGCNYCNRCNSTTCYGGCCQKCRSSFCKGINCLYQ